MQSLKDRTVLVTGSSSGLGLACVQRLLSLGAKVVGFDLSESSEALAANPNYSHSKGSVTDSAAVSAAIELANQFGSLSGAVCCAGILHGERVVGREGPANLDAFRKVIEVNLIGTFNFVRLAADAISKSQPDADGERGVIVTTSSIAAYDGQIGQAAYAASKGAVASMTLPIARELAKLGIRLVSIAPGVFETPMMQAASDKVRQPLLDQTPFPKRFGKPDEFAAMVQTIFENSMLNGSVIRLDAALRM
jgi:NAD(P)-dependent dehydrogenase (short-subunit alcohol dehydrogenase family)